MSVRHARRARGAFLVVAGAPSVFTLAACGGGAATLHPAHTLPQNRMTAGAGVSGQFAFGESTRAIDRAGAVPPGASEAADTKRLLEGAVARSAFAPGVAPWVAGRVGLGGDSEAGLTYTGRTVRADARHAFETPTMALSVGAGASAVFLHSDESPTDSSASTRLAAESGKLSYGFDVPVIAGWKSAASVVEAWVGIRAGFEHLRGELQLATTNEEARKGADVSATRWYGGGLVGAAVGFRPFAVALELDVAYHSVNAEGTFPAGVTDTVRDSSTLSGLTLAPTGAIIGKF